MDREIDYARTPLQRFLLRKLVDPRLNYGRDIIAEYLTVVASFVTVIDIGAGEGKDIASARRVCPMARAIAIEGYALYADRLRGEGIEVYQIDIERDRLPCESENADVVISNQVLEHTKEIFWIFHEISRVLKVGGHLLETPFYVGQERDWSAKAS